MKKLALAAVVLVAALASFVGVALRDEARPELRAVPRPRPRPTSCRSTPERAGAQTLPSGSYLVRGACASGRSPREERVDLAPLEHRVVGLEVE